MRPRPVSFRFLTALSSVLLLQLTLLGSGTLCAMRGAHAMGAAEMTEGMPGGVPRAAASSAALAASDGRTGTTIPSGSCDARDATRSHESPSSPGFCSSMASCTVAVVAAAPVVMDLLVGTRELRISEPRSALIGPSIAPELPPPRA